MTLGAAGAWWTPIREQPDASARLFAFPCAGGAAGTFRRWNELPGHVEVWALCPPGRERRADEPPVATLDAAVAGATAAITGLADRPYALYGHSFGGLLAYRCARRLDELGARAPATLVVASRRPPHVPPRTPSRAGLSDTGLADWAFELGGVPAGLREDRELLDLLLAALRADLLLEEQHVVDDGVLEATRIVAIGGLRDGLLARDDLEGWRRHTRGGFEAFWLDDGHFLPESDVLAVVTREVDGLSPASHAWRAA